MDLPQILARGLPLVHRKPGVRHKFRGDRNGSTEDALVQFEALKGTAGTRGEGVWWEHQGVGHGSPGDAAPTSASSRAERSGGARSCSRSMLAEAF